MTTTQEESRPTIGSLTAFFAAQMDVAAAYLFGSFATGQANSLSDVDVAVLFRSGLDREAMLERQLEFMVDLEGLAGREVQVVALNDAAPLLAYQVYREGRLLCEHDQPARIEFEVRAMKLYFDLQPFFAYYDRALAERIKEEGLGATRRRHPSPIDAAERIRQRLAGTANR